MARAGQPGLLPARRPRPGHRRHRAAATPSTCGTRWSAGWCWTRCATGSRSATSTASASTSRWPSAAARTTTTTPTTRSSWRCAPTRCSRRVKLIAEPWDVGIHGWRTGQFPPPFAEWNDRFRDTVRTFWLQDLAAARRRTTQGHGVRELATRLAGSQDLFGARDRGPLASVNFVARPRRVHAGRPDPLQRQAQRPQRRGQPGRPRRQPVVEPRRRGTGRPIAGRTSARRRSMRNLLATTLLATGVPMLNAGDEFGRTQGGNNNPYCQDNELSWFDWDLARLAAGPARDRPVPHPAARRDTPVAAPAHVLHRAGGPRGRVHRPGVVRRRRRADEHRPWDDPSTRTLPDAPQRRLGRPRVGAARAARRRRGREGAPARGPGPDGIPAAVGQRATSGRAAPLRRSSPGRCRWARPACRSTGRPTPT